MSIEDQARRRCWFGFQSSPSTIDMFLGKKADNGNDCYILELPGPIVMDILRRLPMRTLVQCRFVCKNWRDLVLDPHFAKLYFSKVVPTCVIFQSLMLEKFSVLGINEKEATVSRFPIPETKTKSRVTVENSCNGLVCLRRPFIKPKLLYIANPLTGKYMTLPHTEMGYVACLMGYCPNNNLYKVVKISLSNGKAEICTVGFGTWRSIGYLPYAKNLYRDGLHHNGALHWVSVLDGRCDQMIVTIELESERLRMLSPPPAFSLDRRQRRRLRRRRHGWQTKLGKLRDCLSIWRSEESYADIEIWVMKEYGVKESWSKELVIKNPNPSSGWRTFELITTLENGDIVITSHGRFYIYDPKKESFKILLDHETCGTSILHIPSFISPRDIVTTGTRF